MFEDIVLVSNCEDEYAQLFSTRLKLGEKIEEAEAEIIRKEYCDNEGKDAILWVIDWRNNKEQAKNICNILAAHAKEKLFANAVVFILESPADELAVECWCSEYPRIMRLLFTSALEIEEFQAEIKASIEQEKKVIIQNRDTEKRLKSGRGIDSVKNNVCSSGSNFVTLGLGTMHDFMHNVRVAVMTMYRKAISRPEEVKKEDLLEALKKLSKAYNEDSEQIQQTLDKEKAFLYSDEFKPPPHLLLTGETGVGKSLLAKLLSQLLELRIGKMIKINTSGLSENLLENQIFGCLKGSATDISGRLGSVLSASYGLLFFDEIGDLPMELQSRLLTFLDDNKVRPDGFEGEIGPVPLYIVAATNKNLEEEVKRGNFRADLLNRFRLKLRIPGMNERREDLPELVKFCLNNPEVNFTLNNSEPGIRSMTARMLSILRQLDYTDGNYRLLEEIIGEAVQNAVRNCSPGLDIFHLPEKYLPEAEFEKKENPQKSSAGFSSKSSERKPLSGKIEDSISEEQWKKIEEILPVTIKSGPNIVNKRKVIQGILWKTSNEVGWKKIPVKYGSYSTCRRYYNRCCEDGVWQEILEIIETAFKS